LAWKSGLVPLLHFVPPAVLNYSAEAGVTALCRKYWPFGALFLKFEACKTKHYFRQRAVTPDRRISNLKKSVPN
jgi:hypothetical protein